MDPLRLVTRYFDEVSNEPDAGRRREAIRELFAEDVHYVDQDGAVDGRDAFIARIDRLAAMMSEGTRFSPRRDPQRAGEAVVYHWQLGRTGQPPGLVGVDVAIIREDRIAQLYAVVD